MDNQEIYHPNIVSLIVGALGRYFASDVNWYVFLLVALGVFTPLTLHNVSVVGLRTVASILLVTVVVTVAFIMVTLEEHDLQDPA